MAKKWNDVDEDTAKECEKLFQNGGPRVYVKGADESYWRLRPSQLSASRAQRLAEVDEEVYARRKDCQRFVWKMARGE
jgi:hypothetical protein